MEHLVEEFGHPTYTAFPVIIARLVLAAVFGAAIGFEREWRRRPAGLRTHILVCVGAAVFALLTIEIVHAPDFKGEPSQFDPIRMIEATTAGVAFLAAGVVIFSRGQLHGLTTGAGMWLAGAIGVACGLGLWQVAALGAALALLILGLLYRIERRLNLDERGYLASPESDGGADGPRTRPIDRGEP